MAQIQGIPNLAQLTPFELNNTNPLNEELRKKIITNMINKQKGKTALSVNDLRQTTHRFSESTSGELEIVINYVKNVSITRKGLDELLDLFEKTHGIGFKITSDPALGSLAKTHTLFVIYDPSRDSKAGKKVQISPLTSTAGPSSITSQASGTPAGGTPSAIGTNVTGFTAKTFASAMDTLDKLKIQLPELGDISVEEMKDSLRKNPELIEEMKKTLRELIFSPETTDAEKIELTNKLKSLIRISTDIVVQAPHSTEVSDKKIKQFTRQRLKKSKLLYKN